MRLVQIVAVAKDGIQASSQPSNLFTHVLFVLFKNLLGEVQII